MFIACICSVFSSLVTIYVFQWKTGKQKYITQLNWWDHVKIDCHALIFSSLIFFSFFFNFIPSSKEKLKRSNYLQTNTLPSPKAHSKHTTGTTVKAQWWREPKSCANREDEPGSHLLNCTVSRFTCSPQLGVLDTVSATMFPSSCCSQPLLFWTLSLWLRSSPAVVLNSWVF